MYAREHRTPVLLQMNVNDSEVLLSVLAASGFEQTDSDTSADVVLLNTCAIRERAEQRIHNRLEKLRQLKLQNAGGHR